MFYSNCVAGFFLGSLLALLFVLFLNSRGVVRDTLKNPKTNQWSRKSLTGFLCMMFAMGYCTYGVVKEKEIKEFVVAIFVGASLSCLGLSSWEKANVKNESDK